MAKDFPLVNLITSLKEPTVWPRSACGGQDCHGEEGFPTARGKESIEELVMAAVRGGVDRTKASWETCKRGNFKEPQGGRHGQSTGQETEQGKRSQKQAGPTQGGLPALVSDRGRD